MTKQLRNDLQNLFNKIQSVEEEKDQILKELQKMCSDLGLPVYCGWEACYDQLKERTESYTKYGCNTTYKSRAKSLFYNFCRLGGQQDMLEALGEVLANNNFWKKEVY